MVTQRTIDILQNRIATHYFTDVVVNTMFMSVKGLHSRMSRLLKSQDILRLKRGFYVFAESRRKQQLNVFEIANALYGPSYVSLESALSYHGLIPEAVVKVLSVNINRTKLYSTPIGTFQYRKIHKEAFPYGVTRKETDYGTFLIATPEKALLDKLYLDASKQILLNYVTESLRIDESNLAKLDLKLLISLSYYYNDNKFAKRVSKLIVTVQDFRYSSLKSSKKMLE